MDRAWDANRDGGAGRRGVGAVGRSGRFVAGSTRPFRSRTSGAGASAHEVSAENEKGKLRPRRSGLLRLAETDEAADASCIEDGWCGCGMVAGVAVRRRDVGSGGSGVGRDIAVIVVVEVALEGAFCKALVDPEVEVAGGLQLVVTEKFFDDADGGAVHEEGCGERVADDVGRHLLGDTGAKRNVLGAVLDGLRMNGPAVWPDEDEVAVSGAAVEVLLEPGEGGGTEIDRALFVALADNLSLALGKVE